jgi:FkbM family methyltransferase
MIGRRGAEGAIRMVASAIGLSDIRRTAAGRRLMARVNVAGEHAARWLYLRQGVPVEIDGHKMFLSRRRGPSLGFVNEMVHSQYETDLHELLGRVIRDGMKVVDVGAHVGHYTLMAARLVGPNGRVYAFEADSENVSLLEQNVALNGYCNVNCIHAAVSDHSGELTLYVSRQGNDRHTTVPDEVACAVSIARTVAATTLDEFAAAHGWPSIDLVKLDIEGAEPRAIEGMRELIRRCPEMGLVVEFAPALLRAGGNDPVAFLMVLDSYGFKIEPIEPGMPAWNSDGQSGRTFTLEAEGRGSINLYCRRRLERVDA